MQLSANIDKYLSYAEKTLLDSYATNVELHKKMRDIASANADRLQTFADQHANNTSFFPDSWSLTYVDGTMAILGWPNAGITMGGKGIWAVILWTEMNAFRAERDKQKALIDSEQKELDAHILTYNAKYLPMVQKDADKSRDIDAINVAANNTASIETRKITTYIIIGVVALIALIFAFKKIK